MGCGCFTIKKKSSFSYKHTEKRLCLKRNLVFSINSWNIVLDFLTYKELNSTAKLCRKFLYISRSPKLLLKFFKNKEFLHKLQLAKRNNLLQQENCDDRTVSPHFLSLINKSINSNENSKYNSSRIKELDDSKKLTLTNKTPSFKYESSCRSINNTVSNINPPETGINTNSENSKHNDYKDANVVFCKINRESIKDQTFKTTKDIIKQSSNQILYYGNIMEKNSYGTEFTKLSSSIHSANQSLYDSKASYNTGCLFNVKSNTINDNRPQNVLSK